MKDGERTIRRREIHSLKREPNSVVSREEDVKCRLGIGMELAEMPRLLILGPNVTLGTTTVVILSVSLD
jgi:hypothetical protein